ncbi:MAG: hypothetical protein FJ253_09105 [Phycisphaerae bacterium]|nr:hypothetical protein [Phycisphaerae bacterium]
MKFNSSPTIVAGLVSFAVGGAVLADSATAPEMRFSMSIGGNLCTWTDSWGVSAGGPYWAYNDSYEAPGGSMMYQLLVDPDPILGFDLGFTNTTETDQDFHIVLSLPVAPFSGGTKIGGMISGSLVDESEDGFAAVSSVGTLPIFDATIDDVTWLTLFDSPFQALVTEVGGTTEIGPDADGLPGTSKDGPFVVQDLISVELNFRLSAGDTVWFNGIFIVEYVPAPPAALLLVGLIAKRRRRN